jgi:outer membrane lipoprotein-sorting protein
MTRGWLALVAGAVLWGSIPAARTSADAFTDVQEILAQCLGAYHRLVDYRGTVRQEVWKGGTVVRQDVIEVIFRKPSFLSLRWQSGLYEGTWLLGRADWEQGTLLVRLGGWFEFFTFSILSAEASEPFIPGLKDVHEWLTALVALARRPTTDRSLRLVQAWSGDPSLAEGQVRLAVPAFLIPFRDNAVASYEFVIERGTGVPLELVLRGSAGEVRQRITYTDLQINVGVPVSGFQWPERTEGRPGQLGGTAAIDLRRFIQHWQRRYAEITDYTGVWVVEERRRERMNHGRAVFKFRKPFDVYLEWRLEGGGRREVLFREGWNDGRVRVRTEVLGIPLIGDLAPTGYLARGGYHHPLTEFGLNRLVERVQDQLLHEWLRGELDVEFLGVQEYEDRPCYVFEFVFLYSEGYEQPSSRVVMYWDVAQRIPVKYERFDQGELEERYEFRHLRLNVSLNDSDFDPANPAYGFLLFRRAPRLDWFLTGRE